MKVVILGSGSFAGQALFSHLLLKGEEVYGINRSLPKPSCMWPWRKQIDTSSIWNVFNIREDIDAIIDLVLSIKPTHIVDFMGQGMVAQSWEDPYLWFDTNISYKSKLVGSILNLDSLEMYIRASTPEVFGSSF